MPSSPHLPPSRPRAPSSSFRSTTGAPARTSPRTPTSSLFPDDPDMGILEDEWDAPGSEFLNAPRASGRRTRTKARKKKDEPMKPITVILYVIFFYLIWQILTRSTEVEILSHLSPSSPHHYHLSSLPESTSSPNHLPYQFPQFPSPLPPTSPASSSSSPSTTRWIFGLLVYPFYILLLPLPLILNTVYIIVSILSTLLFPLIFTGRTLAQIFVRTPYAWARAVGAAVYPLYVFVGGMVGVGCVMGLGAGWAGRKGLEWAVGEKKSESRTPGDEYENSWRSATREAERAPERDYPSMRHSDLAYRSKHSRSRQYSGSQDSSASDSPHPHNPRTPTRPRTSLPSVYPQDSVSRRGGEAARSKGKERAMSYERDGAYGTSREGRVIGTRRRGVRYEDE